MDNFLFRIHYESDHIVVETKSLSKEILEYPDKRKTYIFETPSLYQQDAGNVNIFVYYDQLHIEWLDSNKKIIKATTVPGRTIMKHENELLKFYTYSE